MPEPTRILSQEAYYRETVTILADRITVLALISAGILALKHPGFVGPSSNLVRATLRQLIPLAYRYTPPEILAEWEQVLGTIPREGD